jgi:hypothetical protein
MTIERLKGDMYSITCDKCPEYFEVDGDWSDVLKELKNLKWTYVNTKYGWEHFCPDCIQENVAKVFGPAPKV